MSPLDISSSPNQRWLAKEFASSLEQSHRSTRNDVHGYVDFAQHLSETEGPEPDPSFRAALRHRLLHELIEDELVPQYDELALRREERTRRKGGSHCFERAPREPWVAAASTVLVVCGGAVGLGQDSSHALPGDVLYPVKRFFETGELAMANSSGGEARELMDQASERLGEAQQLVDVDEIHAQQALPETIVDFNEATTEAGNIIVEQSRTHSIDPAVVAEFHSFSTESRTTLDEIAEDAGGDTAALIDDARTTLDSFDDLLPELDPVLDTVEDLPVAMEAINVLGSGGNDHADHVSETPLESSNTDAAESIDSTVSSVDDTVDNTIDDATAALTGPVAVVDLSTSDTVSVAVATVHNTAKMVDKTVANTLKTVDKTLKQTADAVNETVRKTTEAAQQAVDHAAQLVDDTAQTATDAVQTATDSVQTATDALGDTVATLQHATGSLQQATDSLDQQADDANPPAPTLPDVADDTTKQAVDTLQSVTNAVL